MRFEIKDLQRRFGFSILYVTHDQSEAMALADRILVMRAGVVQQIGTPVDVYTAPVNRFVFEFIGLSNFLDVRAIAGGPRGRRGAAVPGGGRAAAAGARRRRRRGARDAPDRESSSSTPAGLPGIVARKAFLGETVDYRIAVGAQEVRVQKSRHVPGPAVGEACRLAFPRPRWYPAEAAART